MADKAFIDTNILLRVLLPPTRLHLLCDELLKSLFSNEVDVWINGQVIREFLVQATHPNTTEWTAISMNSALTSLERLLPSLRIADDSIAVQTELRNILRQYPVTGKSIHDANIVATMLAYEIDILYTLDHGFTRYSDQISVLDAEGVAHIPQS